MNKFIITQGFGYSGSSALFDFFKELDNCHVIDAEFDLLRHAGGLFALEHSLYTPNIFIQHHAIKTFLQLVSYLHRSPERDGAIGRNYQTVLHADFYQISEKFIHSFLTASADVPYDYFNGHLVDPTIGNLLRIEETNSLTRKLYQKMLRFYLTKTKKKNRFAYQAIVEGNFKQNHQIYYSVPVSSKTYRDRAKTYLETVFSPCQQYEYTVLDQALSVTDNDIDSQLEFLGDGKVFYIARDPRDIYMDGIVKGREWIPTHQVDNFIAWYRAMHHAYPVKHSRVMNIRFEELVLHYDKVIPKVYSFLGIHAGYNKAPRSCFDPDASKKNIGLWKAYPNQDIMRHIYNQLNDYCWEA